MRRLTSQNSILFFSLCLLNIIELNEGSSDHYYSSLKDMQQLIPFEDYYINTIEKYIEREMEQLQNFERFLNSMNSHLQENIASSNLFNDLTLFNQTWNSHFENLHAVAPKKDADVVGAARAIARIHSTYQIPLQDLRKGHVHGNVGLNLTLMDFYRISQEIFELKDYEGSIDWFMYLLETGLSDESNALNKSQIFEVMDKLHQSLYQIGNSDDAVAVTKMMLNLATDEDMIEEIETYLEFYDQNVNEEYLANNENNNQSKIKHLCQGNYLQNLTLEKSLNCVYDTKNSPFYLLNPFKKEQIYSDPNIFIYHDFLSRNETEILLGFGKNRSLERSLVNSGGKYISSTEIRTSKVTWISYSESNFTKKLENRIRNLMGSIKEHVVPELIQVANYGIGGHYNRHLDSVARNLYESNASRVATLLIYLNDVESGGSTVFTEIGRGVKPIKGAAVLWENYLPSGELDDLTHHTACPVLYGEKWGVNVWITLGTSVLTCPIPE